MVNFLVIKHYHISTIQCLGIIHFFLKKLNSAIEIESSLCDRLTLANREALFLKVIIINAHCVILCSENGKRFFLEFLTHVI